MENIKKFGWIFAVILGFLAIVIFNPKNLIFQEKLILIKEDGNKTEKIQCVKTDEDEVFIYCKNQDGTLNGYNKRYIAEIKQLYK